MKPKLLFLCLLLLSEVSFGSLFRTDSKCDGEDIAAGAFPIPSPLLVKKGNLPSSPLPGVAYEWYDFEGTDTPAITFSGDARALVTESLFRRFVEAGYLPYYTHRAKSPKFQFDSPNGRGIIHIPTTLGIIGEGHYRQEMRKAMSKGYRLSMNEAFAAVVERCATQPRRMMVRFDPANPDDEAYPTPALLGKQSMEKALAEGFYYKWDPEKEDFYVGTSSWLIEGVRELYLRNHHRGESISLEVWRGDTLVAGSFGSSINRGHFTIWSTFFTENHTGLIANAALIAYLNKLGFEHLDMEEAKAGSFAVRFGAKAYPREQALPLLLSERERQSELREASSEELHELLLPLYEARSNKRHTRQKR